MRMLLFFVAGVLMLSACSNDKSIDTNTTVKPSFASHSIPQDSLQNLYSQFIANHDTERFPAQRIYEKGKLYPFDESLTDSVFFVYKSQILEAIKRKDIFFLIENIAEDIQMENGQQGDEAFMEHWKLTDQSSMMNSALWGKLEQILSKGGSLDKASNTYKAPYWAALNKTIGNEVNAVITGQGVRMRKNPNLSASIVATLSFDQVKFIENTDTITKIGNETYAWVKIATIDGKEGYVWGKFISQLEETLTFQKRNGRWKIVQFG